MLATRFVVIDHSRNSGRADVVHVDEADAARGMPLPLMLPHNALDEARRSAASSGIIDHDIDGVFHKTGRTGPAIFVVRRKNTPDAEPTPPRPS